MIKRETQIELRKQFWRSFCGPGMKIEQALNEILFRAGEHAAREYMAHVLEEVTGALGTLSAPEFHSCILCGTEFVVNVARKDKTLCSPACNAKSYRQRKKRTQESGVVNG